MRLLFFILLLSLSATVARAEYKDGGHPAVQTRFGILQVEGARGEQRLTFNGTDMGVAVHAIEIDGVWGLEDADHDWTVVHLYHGGNMCGGFDLMALRLSAGAVTRTNQFGVCRGSPTDIRITADAMELDVSDPDAFTDYRSFRFDGTNLSETKIAGAPAQQPSGAGADVTRWLDTHPQSLTQDPGEQARFAAIMTREQFQNLNTKMSGPGATSQEGDWVIGRGCQAHNCGDARAVWALRISDGTPIAMLYETDTGTQVFGQDVPASDPVISQLLQGGAR